MAWPSGGLPLHLCSHFLWLNNVTKFSTHTQPQANSYSVSHVHTNSEIQKYPLIFPQMTAYHANTREQTKAGRTYCSFMLTQREQYKTQHLTA